MNNSKHFVIACLLGLTTADQPVKCLREQVYGEWNFHVNQDIQKVNLF